MEKKNRKGYCIKSDSAYLCNPFWKEHEWEFSSAGSEHLPYKQRVGGSNPSTPTENLEEIRGFFCLNFFIIYVLFVLHSFFRFKELVLLRAYLR